MRYINALPLPLPLKEAMDGGRMGSDLLYGYQLRVIKKERETNLSTNKHTEAMDGSLFLN